MTDPSLTQGKALELSRDYYGNAFDVLSALVEADTPIKITLTNADTGEEIYLPGINLLAPADAPVNSIETDSVNYITNLLSDFADLRDAAATALDDLACDE